MPEPHISVIVAAFNEEETIERCVRRVFAVFPQDCELLVVDGGSDQTGEVVKELAREYPDLRYIRNENDLGKGHAIQKGVEMAEAQVMAQIDADLQFLPEELPRLIEPIETGKADVVLGSRFIRDSVRLPGSTPMLRTLGNKATSLYASVLFWHRMTDVLAGMKAWTRDAIRAIDLKSINYSYEVEIPVKALANGFRVVDVPITTQSRLGGETCVNVVSDGMALLRDITLFRFNLK